MKRIVICSIIAAVIIAGSICSVLYTAYVADSVVGELQNTKAAYAENDTQAAKQSLESASERWDFFCRLHILITDKEHILEITQIIARIKSMLEENGDDLTVECDAAAKLIMNYKQEQLPGILNIL